MLTFTVITTRVEMKLRVIPGLALPDQQWDSSLMEGGALWGSSSILSLFSICHLSVRSWNYYSKQEGPVPLFHMRRKPSHMLEILVFFSLRDNSSDLDLLTLSLKISLMKSKNVIN